MFLCFVKNDNMLQLLYQLYFMEYDLYEIDILIFEIFLVFDSIICVMLYHMLWFHFPYLNNNL